MEIVIFSFRYFWPSKVPITFIIFIFILYGQCDSSSVIQVSNIPSIGEWYNWQECERGSYVTGFRVKWRPYQGVKDDDGGLVGVTLYCSEPGREKNSEEIGVYSTEFGEWTSDYFCPGGKPAVGFHLKYSWENWDKINKFRIKRNSSELVSSSSAKVRDLLGVTNMRLVCTGDDEKNELAVIEPVEKMYNPGTWLTEPNCPNGEFICKVQVQFGSAKVMEESNSTNINPKDIKYDFVGVNNMNVGCCPIRNQAELCKPTEKWELLFEYDNRNSINSVGYSFEVKYGVRRNNASNPIPEIELMQLRNNFVQNFNQDAGQFDWPNSADDLWNQERPAKMDINIAPGSWTKVYQVTGVCEDWRVRPNKIYQNSTMAEKEAALTPPQMGTDMMVAVPNAMPTPGNAMTAPGNAMPAPGNANTQMDLRAQSEVDLGKLIFGDKMIISSMIMLIMGIFLYLT